MELFYVSLYLSNGAVLIILNRCNLGDAMGLVRITFIDAFIDVFKR
jgi:hypothetical protein